MPWATGTYGWRNAIFVARKVSWKVARKNVRKCARKVAREVARKVGRKVARKVARSNVKVARSNVFRSIYLLFLTEIFIHSVF